MIDRIHEHTVDLSILPEKANILDLGCRGFQFTNYFKELGHNVWPVDIDVLEGSYSRIAISNYNGFAGVKRSNDPQATRIERGNEVPCYTLNSFTSKLGLKMWDLVKSDIEGSEYEVIMSLEEPPATQLSIEFHLHTGIYGEKEMREMENVLFNWYKPVVHELTSEHGAGFNYWSSLFILK